MNRLIFTRADVSIFEDRDFPEDPAPYAMLAAREFPVYLEIEEGEALGRALLQWTLEITAREARLLRDAKRKERELLEAMHEAAAGGVVLPAGALVPASLFPTGLEIVRRSHARPSSRSARSSSNASSRSLSRGR